MPKPGSPPIWLELSLDRSADEIRVSGRGSRSEQTPPFACERDAPAMLRFAASVQHAAGSGKPLAPAHLADAQDAVQALCAGEIEPLLAVLRAAADGPLLVRLMVHDPELQGVPWEALCKPGEALGFWGSSPDLLPVRGVTSSEPWEPSEVRGAVRVLAIAPGGGRSLANLKDALTDRIVTGEVEWLDPLEGPAATATALFDRLRREPVPHVLHFLGHGGHDRGTPVLRLADDDEGQEAWLQVELLAQQLKASFRGALRLVVLEACEGARPSAFASAAEMLARAGADAVVAHLWPIKADVARRFSEQLYRALAGANQSAGDIAIAMNEARRAILGAFEASAEALSPVLYLRGPDGGIFDFASRDVRPSQVYEVSPARETARDPAHAQRPRALPLPGDMLAGKYRVERVVGKGPTGVVVAAMHVDLHQVRAIQIMSPSALKEADHYERFIREARAVAGLKSQHVAKVYDFGRLDDGAPYLVMEFLQGMDLSSHLASHGALQVTEAVTYIRQACEALAEAHAAGIVHRDLRPSSLYLTQGVGGAPCIKVLDFGIARMSSPAEKGAADPATTATSLGAPLYRSPEQMRSTPSVQSVDARTDVWALGALLYWMLTGKTPFAGTSVAEISSAVASDPPEPPASVRAEIPPGLEAVILRCLEKDAAKRFSNAGKLAAALAPFARAGPSVAPPESSGPESRPTGTESRTRPAKGQDGAPGGQRSRAALWGIGALGIGALVAGGLWLRSVLAHPEPTSPKPGASGPVSAPLTGSSAVPDSPVSTAPVSPPVTAPTSTSTPGAPVSATASNGTPVAATSLAIGEPRPVRVPTKATSTSPVVTSSAQPTTTTATTATTTTTPKKDAFGDERK